MFRMLALVFVAMLPAAYSVSASERHLMTVEEAVSYQAVGRLNVAGTRFCTATLISSSLVITAAHCLFHPRTHRPVPLSEFRFVAGLYRENHVALRRVQRAAVLPGFDPDRAASLDGVQQDLALIELAEPVGDDLVVPFELSPPMTTPGPVTIVSYARDRSHAPSIQEACEVPVARNGIAVVSCAVNYGASGAPVLARFGTVQRLVAIVSAMGKDKADKDLTLAVIAVPNLERLQDALARSEWRAD